MAEQPAAVDDADPVRLCVALDLIEARYAVFPLKPGDEVPLDGSRRFNDATRSESQARKWWGPTAYAQYRHRLRQIRHRRCRP